MRRPLYFHFDTHSVKNSQKPFSVNKKYSSGQLGADSMIINLPGIAGFFQKTVYFIF
jgi:hypothetical protein